LRNYLKKEQNKFLFVGIFNLLITNIILQFLLLVLIPILATLISQSFNFIIGFFLYGIKVFNKKKLRLVYFIKYLTLSIVIWNINWILILFLNSYGISKNIASLFIIPLLALISYTFQKYLVFAE
tara:strand:+ start:210 stop:584 length:375 start_codon:yes stop_codon:yes gene_type:complete